MKDVAKKANVSKMTVSRVINHPELVTQELKDLVYQAMKELDYRPNTVAKALAKNRTLVVKVLILEEMDTTEPYFMNLVMGIAKELDRYQYALQLVTENSLNLGDCDGYIITGMKEHDFEWIQKIKKPVVLFGENDYHIPYVDSNNQAATRFATKYAKSCGYEKIQFIGIDVPEKFEASREKGYLEAMELMQLEANITRIDNHSSSAAKLIENFDKWQENTCFICASDRIAIGIERQLLLEGKKIPDDYGIIGFDGVFLDQIAAPKLTTMKQDVVEMGKICVAQLMALIEGEELTQKEMMHEAKMVVRGTTK
ncbi:transcriptional regulator, LacI family [Granulicatella balaenopterae]|uniref:Transcriptional regulator, LacI family n=1 Tax=Granulicatella balaenopterae TaxID=137733 RepID=A0A1H9L4G2_9LACT|nr:transcriptional regulator, LacI family [Granulicatella balaenopterae]